MAVNGFTAVQSAMLEILNDGCPHTREDLHACLPDELQPLSAIRVHISLLRKQLRPRGKDILVEFIRRKLHYRQVRLLASAVDGKR